MIDQRNRQRMKQALVEPFGPPRSDLERRALAAIAGQPGRRTSTLALALAAFVLLMAVAVSIAVAVRALRPDLGPVAPSTAVPIETAQFLSPQDGLVVTQRGLLITRDGGQTWQLTLKLDWHNYQDIRFVDPDHTIVVSSSTVGPPQPVPLRLHSTADGGAHWQTTSIAPITAGTARIPFFLNDREGWELAYSGDNPANPTMAAIYHTTDGGAHWTQLHQVDATRPSSGGLQLASAPEDVFFTDSTHGFMGTASHDNVGRLFVTRDGGRTWRAAVVPTPPGGWFPGGGGQDVFTRASAITMLGDTGFLTQVSGQRVDVYSTYDGGQTWGSPRLLPFGKGRAYFLDRTHWWVTGEGTLYETVDGGSSWQRLPDVPANIWPYLEALSATGPQVLWGELIQSSIPGDSPIAGVPPSACFQSPYGPECSFLVRSTDGGHHWTDVKLPSS